MSGVRNEGENFTSSALPLCFVPMEVMQTTVCT